MRFSTVVALVVCVFAGCSSTSPVVATTPPCKFASDCTTSPTGHVCVAGACVVCGVNGDCPTGQKCDAMKACVDCLGAGDCAAGQKCVAKSCAAGCDDKNPCATGKVCDPALGACVACVTAKDCGAPTPACDAAAHKCVACVADEDCGPGKLCLAQMCTTGCDGHNPCPSGMVCNVGQGACVQCVGDGDCKTSTATRCDVRSQTCVQCLPSSDNCPSGQYCAGDTCQTGCRTNADCGGGTPACDMINHVCAQCIDDTACPAGQVCAGERCVAGCDGQHACSAGQGCCGGACVSVLSDNNNCGGCGTQCASGGGCCGGACVPLSTVANCGACGNACADVVNGARACASGKCVIGGCDGSFKDCDGVYANGCEVDLSKDLKNCGACGTACGSVANSAKSTCVAGACTLACTGSFRDCNGTFSDGCEADVSSDVKNCGACGNACATGVMCSSGMCGAKNCAAILASNASAMNGTYTIDPDGGGPIQPFQVYCDMTNDGGGWTLVRVDDNTDKSVVKFAGAVGSVPATLVCSGSNVKLADSVIAAIWTTKMRYTVKADTTGAMTYMSDTGLSSIGSWSDQCGNNNKITWYFKQAPNVPSQAGTLNNHPEYCGWSFGPCATTTEYCWFGPHTGYKVHDNPSYAHINVPSNISALGSDAGCGFGWVR